jgi:hypothetical protein
MRGVSFDYLVDAQSNVCAIRHLNQFMASSARAARRIHQFSADLTVRRMFIVGDRFLVCNFLQSTAVGAFKGLSHVTDVL